MTLRTLCFVGFVLFGTAAYAQDLSGDWQGTLIAGQEKIRLVVTIVRGANGWSAKYYSPDNDDAGVSVRFDSVSLQGEDVKLAAAASRIGYDGKLSADGGFIEGTWTPFRPNGTPRGLYPLSLQRATPDTAFKHASPHTSQFVTVDKDVQLEVLDWGGNGKPLVFLAGLSNSAHVFDKFAPNFTKTHHVYGISRRGIGASSVPPTGYSSDRLGDDVLAVFDALKLTKPVVVGHSFGGAEMSSIGSRFPEKVAGLIYLDAGYEYAFYDKARGHLILDLTELQRKLVQLEPAHQLADPRPLFKELLETVLPAFERSLKRTQEDFDVMGPQAIAALAGDASSPVEEAIQAGMQKYTAVSAPILAIFASPHRSPPLPPNAPPARVKIMAAMVAREAEQTEAQVGAFERGLPSAKVVRLPGADHFVFRSNEADVLREMNAFLGTLP